MSMHDGSVYSSSTKQKLVLQSSTESKLIGVHDTLPQVLWTQKLLIRQGYMVNNNILIVLSYLRKMVTNPAQNE